MYRSRKRKFAAATTSLTEDDAVTATLEQNSCTDDDHELQRLRQLLEEKDKELTVLKNRLAAIDNSAPYMSYQRIMDDDSVLCHYTGLPNKATFECVKQFSARFNVCASSWTVQTLSVEDQLLLTLMKLRHNFTHKHLAFLFNVSVAAVSKITVLWIDVLHELLFVGVMKANGIPSRQKNLLSLPTSFDSFQGARITLDCTEIQCAVPRQNMAQQSATFSHYKQRNMFKALVGVAPNATITFVSELYPGSVSDKQIVMHSKLLDQMKPGDLILADKGFLLHDSLPQGVSVNIPPFLTTQQFSKEQVMETTRIARARIHVERAIQRLKVFHILHFIPASYRSKASKIFQLCACLANLQTPIIKSVDLQPVCN